MVGCWQINSILANTYIGYKNSIPILNQYTFFQCLMKCMNMGIVYLFYKVLIMLEIKVALISCSLSKAASKAAEKQVDCSW